MLKDQQSSMHNVVKSGIRHTHSAPTVVWKSFSESDLDILGNVPRNFFFVGRGQQWVRNVSTGKHGTVICVPLVLDLKLLGFSLQML